MLSNFSSCKFNSQLLAVCLEERVFLNCPRTLFKNSLKCVTMKEDVESCRQTITSDQFHGVEKILINN